MARIIPDNWRFLRAAASLPVVRKLDTLECLGKALPTGFTVYLDVCWSRVEAGSSLFGSIDFAVVSPNGSVLLIEQQSGYLVEDNGLARRGRHVLELVHSLGRSASAVSAGLAPIAGPTLEAMLYLPDYTVKDRASVGVDATRILDASSADGLVPYVQEVFAGLSAADKAPDLQRAAAVNRYFSDALRVVVDVGAQVGAADKLYARLSGGLCEWARRIEMHPHRVRISATAGSGKTQLALSLFEEAIRGGRRPLFVCFNRPLADHFTQLAPSGGEIASYLQLCNRMVRSSGLCPDFSQADAFERIERAFATMAVPESFRFDELIVDEGQDFSEVWRNALMRLLKPEGRAWWLEDPQQNLYGRDTLPLPGWVGLNSPKNYRSPRAVVTFLNRLMPASKIEAASPVEGADVSLSTYASREELLERTRRAMTEAIGQGFSRDQIVVLSFHGRERSVLTSLERLGPIPLRRFLGQYDAGGNPIYTPGDILCETVYRFKGQSAPCVILSEIDAERFDETGLRKVFVGASRATFKLSLVASLQASKILASTLTDEP